MVQSAPMSDNRFLAAFARLERSAFRRRFRLTAELKRYAVEKGLAEMRRHAEAFVRERLAAVCHGTLSIRSGQGEGTTATIILPKEQEIKAC
jgi:hypothetical protein